MEAVQAKVSDSIVKPFTAETMKRKIDDVSLITMEDFAGKATAKVALDIDDAPFLVKEEPGVPGIEGVWGNHSPSRRWHNENCRIVDFSLACSSRKGYG